jgi:hypothetical protein
MKYAVEIGSSAVMYKTSFVNRGIQGHGRQHGDLINLLSFFKMR